MLGTVAKVASLAAGSGALYFYTQYPKYPGSKGKVGVHHTRLGDDCPSTAIFFPIDTSHPIPTHKEAYVPAFRERVVTHISNISQAPAFLYSWLKNNRSPYINGDASGKKAPLCKNKASPRTGKLPLVIFSHGLMGTLEMYSAFCAGLAERGFIVIAMEHEDGSGLYAENHKGEVLSQKKPPSHLNGVEFYNPENVRAFRKPFLEQRVQDVKNILSVLKDKSKGASDSGSDSDSKVDGKMEGVEYILQHIDTSHIYMAGHSFGGATVVQALHDPSLEIGLGAGAGIDIRGSIILDLWPFPVPQEFLDKGLPSKVPSILINSEAFVNNAEMPLTSTLIRNSSSAHTRGFYIPGICHNAFSDTPFLLPEYIARKMNFSGALDREIAFSAIQHAVGSFLDVCVDSYHSTSTATPPPTSTTIDYNKVHAEIVRNQHVKKIDL